MTLTLLDGRPLDFGPWAWGATSARWVAEAVNDGESDLRILSVGERRPDDVVEYPEAPWEPEQPEA